jgi:DNA-binding transcriptional LysR family regulator
MSTAISKPQRDFLHRLSVGNGLTVRTLETFVAVARLGTMSAAAQHLGMTQSAVSQMIVQVENALGVQLFDRKVRPPALTLQGAALLDPARSILNGVGQFQNVLRWGPATQMPLLRISMMNSFAETVGPVVLSRLRSIATQLLVDTGYAATRARAVADREIDFMVTTDESPSPPGIQSVPVITEPYLVVAPKSYTGDLQALQTLSQELDLIRFGRNPFVNSHFDHALRTLGVEPMHAYQMDTHAVVLQMVASGAGWTILPPLSVHRALARGDNIRVAPAPEPFEKRTVLLISRIGEGAVLLADVHADVSKALRAEFMKTVKSMMPGVAKLITLHKMPAL